MKDQLSVSVSRGRNHQRGSWEGGGKWAEGRPRTHSHSRPPAHPRPRSLSHSAHPRTVHAHTNLLVCQHFKSRPYITHGIIHFFTHLSFFAFNTGDLREAPFSIEGKLQRTFK